jgi:hypothetical protein
MCHNENYSGGHLLLYYKPGRCQASGKVYSGFCRQPSFAPILCIELQNSGKIIFVTKNPGKTCENIYCGRKDIFAG